MKIILVGCGKVGTALARQLSEEGHNVTVIDTNKARVEHISESYDVMGITGNGSSITAIKDGRVVDTSMGFTPLDGIEMGSRCGAIDPAIVPFIMEKENISPKEMQNYMNKECGLLGVSGVSGDMRLLMAAVRKGEPRAVLAYDILIYDIQKYIGGYVAALNGVDAIAFTAGIGENTPELRRDVINGLSYLGVKLDEEKNLIGKNLPEPALISTPDSKVKVYVVETDEELVIASDTRRVVEESRK